MKHIGLFLMGKKGLISLQRLSSSDSRLKEKIVFIVGAKDKAVQEDYFSEIKELSLSLDIPFLERTHVDFSKLVCDYAIAIAWRWMIPTNYFPLIVFHDSLLPDLRGFNPLVTALIRGDAEIGVTALMAEGEFDRGAIIGQSKVKVSYPCKISSAIDMISENYARLLEEVVERVAKDKLELRVQDEKNATYSLWRNEDDYQIDWSLSATEISRFIDAVGFPYMGACTTYDERVIRISQATVCEDLSIVNRVAGKIFKIEKDQPVVVCGTGMIIITEAKYDRTEDHVVFSKLRVRLK
jgi:methionyl-tRNA formyltransferase